MIWKKKEIDVENIPSLTKELVNVVKSGSPVIENIRCVFTNEENNIIYVMMPYDFIDFDLNSPIKTFFLYQAFKN